jgi:hypothetical protein
VPALLKPLDVLLNLPHPLEFLWLLWLVLLPSQLRFLLAHRESARRLPKSGELMSYREVAAVGCVGGFILLTFIFAYCTRLTLDLAGVI